MEARYPFAGSRNLYTATVYEPSRVVEAREDVLLVTPIQGHASILLALASAALKKLRKWSLL